MFGRLIVQGGVTSGLLNALVAEDLPGPGTVFLGVEWKFVKAVGIGEEIVARAEVLSVREDKPICTLATTISNAAGEICLSGTATTYTVPVDEATPCEGERIFVTFHDLAHAGSNGLMPRSWPSAEWSAATQGASQ